MEDVLQQIESVRGMLLKSKKPSYQTTNKKEVRVRCPYCGDSRSDKNHAHLYIQMQPPFKFYCQRCTTAGVLNNQTLRDLGVFNNDLSTSIIDANKNIKNNKGTEKVSFKKNNFQLNKVESPFSINGVNYISNRFQMAFDNEYLVDRYKSITNALQFFTDNRMTIPVDMYRRPMYDFANSVGFMSSDGSHVIFRDITGMQPKRYFNLALTDDNNSVASKIYNIKRSVDILSDEINLVMTEGIFDIMGVYEHFYRDKVEDKNNYIFAAAAGKGYNAVISNYMRMGFLNLNITIYSDSDVDTYFFKNLKESSVYLKNIPITIFYNTKEKDFGVSKDKIALRKVIV
jgi:hypothetical protein